MQYNVGFNFAIDSEKLQDQCGIFDGICAPAIHLHSVVDTASLEEKWCKGILRCNGMHFVALFQQALNKIHPEIVNIPGSVEDNRNSHGLWREDLQYIR
jgi:hypothetical protein